jgi:hypothetical protein
MNAERRSINAERETGTSNPSSATSASASRRPRTNLTRIQLLAFVFILQSAFNILHFPTTARADEAASQPTTEPVAAFPPNSPFRDEFKKLADPDPRVREQARQDLMGMTLADLPAFRQLVASSRPLAPVQAQALHDIVIQVFLAGQKYEVLSDGEDVQTDTTGSQAPYFLGIHTIFFEDLNARLGVPVESRVPGFPAFRFLRDGDMILSVSPTPAGAVFQRPTIETHNMESLIRAITPDSGVPSQDVVLNVLRDGQELRIPIHMAPRPQKLTGANPDALSAFIAVLNQRSEAYWNENFLPLVDHPVIVDAH